ncbi:NADH-ubiquinone oxidoreductase chain 1 [Platanthera zijinensis]|uniref:NADH-ubiquinone oxidoreductase chain 1 n=1 Tax=Platanthera zijinensis TaxID=2320716 RepID=A0AAP0BBT5_9ASPA
MRSHRQRAPRKKHGTDEPHAGKLARVVLAGDPARYTVLICVGPCNSSEIVMAQKQIWSGIPLFPVFVMFFLSRLAETNRAPSDLQEAEVESVAGYNVEYARDAILNSSLLAEANGPGELRALHREMEVQNRLGRYTVWTLFQKDWPDPRSSLLGLGTGLTISLRGFELESLGMLFSTRISRPDREVLLLKKRLVAKEIFSSFPTLHLQERPTESLVKLC